MLKSVKIIKQFIRRKHELPKLDYDYKALEPVISAEIMELHHTKHHQTYITNLDAAEKQLKEAQEKKNMNKIISLAPALRFNGGGHLNHTIFWKNLSPDCSEPDCELKAAIDEQFGCLDVLKKEMSAVAVGVQGSGWGWLGLNKSNKKLQIIAMNNQDPLEAMTGLIPLFGIDVWEHAYYLQYKNLRAKYVESIWDIANWKDISERFKKASC